MFGLEKRKDAGEEAFDLEKELADPEKGRKVKAKVEGRIQELKKLLRAGSGSEDFDKLGILLHGYAAMQKLLTKERPL